MFLNVNSVDFFFFISIFSSHVTTQFKSDIIPKTSARLFSYTSLRQVNTQRQTTDKKKNKCWINRTAVTRLVKVKRCAVLVMEEEHCPTLK